MRNHYDVLIIGAGLSGIGAACHLAMDCPGKNVTILERRNAVGGTWDLFRYPGIRSDSDMFTFGYNFRPWNALKVLADGPAIRQYVNDTARQYGVDKKVQFGIKILRADWSSAQNHWVVSALHEASGETRTYSANFLISCTGYYNFDRGYLPDFPGVGKFKGQCVHPQHWPENLDYSGKRVVIIGSGATAVTLVPSMANTAAHVTMLQRSPTYIFSVPAYDGLSALLNKFLPKSWVYKLARRRNIALQRWTYDAAKRFPKISRAVMLAAVRRQLGKNADMTHFTPTYKPWDQRICAVPNGDLFKSIREGKANVVTDHIDTFTERGIKLKSGRELEADIIVTATGLELQLMGGIELSIDGQPIEPNKRLTYKSVMMQDVPNLAWVFGYTNASWTLKADIACEYVCRLLNYMDQNGIAAATPHAPPGAAEDGAVMAALESGYVQRAQHTLPRQGRMLPWRVMNHFQNDSDMLLRSPLADPALQFTMAPKSVLAAKAEPAVA